MTVLAFDCALFACTACIWRDGEVLAHEAFGARRGQAEALVPMLARVVRTAGVAFADLDRIAVTVGPGHFTGLRAGLATARGLALAIGRPAVGVTTLEAVVAAIPDVERSGRVVVAALDSKLAEPYVQAFGEALVPLSPPMASLPGEAAAALPAGEFLLVGDAAPALAEAFGGVGRRARMSTAPGQPDAVAVARIAAARAIEDVPPVPLYLHPVRVTAPGPRP